MSGPRLPNLRRLVRYGLRFKLTDPGKLLLIGTLIAIMAGSLTLAVPIYHVFTVLVCLLVLALAAGLVFRPRVSVAGGFGPKAVAGQPIAGRFELTNRSRVAAYDLSLGYFELPASLKPIDPERMIRRVGPGREANLELRLQPLRRGLYELNGLRCFTTFPFNLFRTGPRVRRDESLLVMPSFEPIDRVDVPVSARYQPGGIAMTSRIGESPEYIGNRDFRPGDSLRRIDSRAWGRLASPVVKEYQEEYYCRIALVLDTLIPRRRRRGPSGFAELEAAVSLTAAIADAMSRGEYLIDIFAAGPNLYVFRSGRHIAHFENVLEILACVEECRANPFALVGPALAGELGSISAVIFILLDWDRSRQALVRTAAETGCSTKVLIVRDAEPSLPCQSAEDWAGPIRHLTPRQVSGGQVRQL